jgi:hypothetical protein
MDENVDIHFSNTSKVQIDSFKSQLLQENGVEKSDKNSSAAGRRSKKRSKSKSSKNSKARIGNNLEA